MIRKATRLQEVSWAFRKKPLELDEMDFFAETAEARGQSVRQRIIRKLRNHIELREDNEINEHILFFGYKGCGKSTELTKLQSEILNDFVVVNFSVIEKLNPMSFHYIEIFIVMMEQLFQVAVDHNLSIGQAYLDRIKTWEQTEEITKVKGKHFSAEAEAGAEFGINYFLKFFAKLTATAKSSQSLQETLTQVVEPKLTDLIELCNELIREIRLAIHDTQFQDLVIIIEDIDKAPLEKAKELFVKYVGHFTQIKCHLIFTYPLALRFTPIYKGIEPHFSGKFELPMIEVVNKEGKTRDEGMEAMRKIAGYRMDLSLITDSKILDKMIYKSGGCLRDYFQLITEAAEHALDFNKDKIDQEDYDAAYLSLVKEYKSSIADYYPEGQDEKISVHDFYKELVAVAQNENKSFPDETNVAMILRQNMMILGYNGVGWCDVHPIVRDILTERGMLDTPA